MNNELIDQKSWWKRNWKWLVPVSGIMLLSFGIFFSSGMDNIATDFAQAYADPELYENAIEKVKTDERVKELLGEIEPMDKLAILEGEVFYSNNNKTINSSTRLKGSKGKTRLDIIAIRVKKEWKYTKINVRIKNPPEKRQTISIAMEE